VRAPRRAAADKEHSLPGGHVIKLGDGNEEAALEALRAWPGGLQIGGGITPESASRYLEAGASDQERLDEMVAAAGGKERLVLDLSCRKGVDGDYYVVTDRWQKFTSLRVDAPTLNSLAAYCDEFLVHGVDVEGLQTGLELPLLELLGAHAPIPVTYAGGARSLEDCETVARLGQGRVGLTIGSALDIFGGALPFAEVVAWHNAQQALGPPAAAAL
jgi:phosphoribosylformimino-5-aminoimidazole carboxamide ribotide isomerase